MFVDPASASALYRAIHDGHVLAAWSTGSTSAFIESLERVFISPLTVEIYENLGSSWVLWKTVTIEPNMHPDILIPTEKT